MTEDEYFDVPVLLIVEGKDEADENGPDDLGDIPVPQMGQSKK